MSRIPFKKNQNARNAAKTTKTLSTILKKKSSLYFSTFFYVVMCF